jgi:CheY-like chemotaxis protein
VPAPAGPATIETILAEIQAVRRIQEQILDRLVSAPKAEDRPVTGDFTAASRAAVRSAQRKTVLVIEEDGPSRDAVTNALRKAQVPTRAVSSGNEGLAEIAREKPDVMVIDLEMGGTMGGKDVIDLVKATMEWVDIPIILYGRPGAAVDPQAHGADLLVSKGPGSADTLVERVVSFFRRS